jgi:hypothetical protein
MIDRNLDPRTVDGFNAVEDGSSGAPWWCSLRTAAGRVLDEFVIGLAVCGMSVYADSGSDSADREDAARSRAIDAPERAASVGLNLALVGVASEARKLLGDRASKWMVTPSRLLDGMTPAELATSPEGARVVLHELRRASATIEASTGSRARGPKGSAILGAGFLALAVLAATGATASADHNLYPPGWNKPDPNAPQSLFEFRPGWGWNDSQRYWPDQNSRGTPPSRPITDAPVIFGMVPGGHRYHRLP